MEERRGMQSLLQVLVAVLLVCGRGAHGISSVSDVGSGVSGSGSGVSGSGMPGCVSAGFCTCCVPSANQSCVINAEEADMCSCDAGCFERDTCCFDITEVPCLPDIFVEFSPQTYTVTEGTDDYVNVTVRATGFPGPSFDVDSITILLTTESGSAEAVTDFVGVIRSLGFSSDGEWVVMIPILDNSPVELTEFFSVNLATNNPFVVFNNNVSSVEIRDNDILLVELDQPEDTPESNGTAEVCVSVVSGVLQAGLEVLLSLESVPIDQEDVDDFASGPLQVTIASGDTTQCVEFPIRMDNLIEGDEIFSLHIITITIDPPTVSVRTLYVTIVILDSTVGTISVDPPQSVAVVEQTTGAVEVCAVIGGAELERDVIVMLETTQLTATDPDDYSGGVFNLTFERNTTRACVNITIAVDNIFEDDEVFGVSVFSDDSAIQPGSATNVAVTILDEAQIPFDFTNIIGVYLVQESDGAVICVRITGGTLDREVLLMLNTSGQTALEGIDYDSVATALVFAAGESEACADIPFTQDQVVESPENFRVILSSSDPDVVFVRDEATVNIIDSTQFVLGFVPVNYTVQESGGSVEVCVAQTSSPPVQFARDVPLLFNTFNGMASAPMDFTAVMNEMVDFPSTSCLTITIIDDSEVEPDESFTVAVTSSDPAVIPGDDVATVTISDVEAPIGIEFSLYEVGEAGGFQEVCVVANGLLSQDVQVFLQSRDVSTTSGTGGNSDDFVAVSDTLVLVAGSNPRTCVNITINDDAFDEISEETFVIDLTLFTSLPVFRNTTEVVIQDDDEVEVGFSPQVYTVSEGLNTAVTFCVSLNGLLQRNGVTVRVTTSDITAMSGSDYTSINQTLVFNSGDQQMCVDIDILDDSVTEQTEVFSISLESVSGEGIFDSPATVSILDDDEDFVFEFTNLPFIGVYIFSEIFGFGEVCVGTRGVLSREVIVTLNTSDLTAISPDDYTSTTVDLAFNMSTTEICTNITLEEDLTVESVEEFRVRLSSSDPAVSFAMDEARVFIGDATTFVLGFVPVDYTVQESGGSVEVCVAQTSSPPVQFARVVPLLFNTFNGMASAPMDFTAVMNEMVDFPSTSCLTITIIDDSVVEPDESFTVAVTSSDPAVIPGDDVATVTISDVEAPIGIEFSLYEVGEAGGFQEVCVVANGLLSQDVQVFLQSRDVSTTSGTGGNSDDFVAVSDTLVLVAGSNPRTCVNITINDDAFDEISEETFVIDLTLFTSLPVFRNTTEVVIQDDDEVEVGFSPQEYTVSEGLNTAVTFCVSLNGLLQRNGVTVRVTTSDITAMSGSDYTSINQTLVFNSGDQQMCVDIDILDDSVTEQTEVFSISLESVSGEGIFNSPATVSILDDDEDFVFEFTNLPFIGVYIFSEIFGFGEVCVGTRGVLSREVIVTLNTSDLTATSPDDYTSTTVDLAFNMSTTEICTNITLEEDLTVESVEEFRVRLSSSDPAVSFAMDEAQVFIGDATTFVLGFVPVNYTVQESGGSVEVCVAQTSSPPVQFARDVPLLFNTFNGMASAPMDFTAVMNEMVDFPSTSCLTITIIDDSVVEPDESFTVAVTSSDPAVIPGDDVATVTISDVEAPIGIEFSLYEVGEADGFQEVCVVANGLLSQDIEVFLQSRDVSTTSGTGGNSDDFVAVSDTLVLVAGSNPRTCVNITINDDAFDEISEETFVIDLTLFTSLPVFRNTTEVVIQDDDEVEVGFSPQEYTVSEGLNTAVTFCVSLNGLLQRNGVTVRVTTSDITAMSGSDYTSINQTLVFNSGDQQMCVDIDILDDSVTEQTEVFSISLESVSGEGIFNSPATVSILDDDEDFVFEFTNLPFIGVYIFSEIFGFGEVCVGTRGVLSREVIVTLNTSDLTATSPDDYTSTTVDLAFNMSTTEICTNITLEEDLTVESVEEFRVRLSSSDPAVSFAMDEARVFIGDATTFVLGFVPVDYTVQESSGSVEVCVAQTSSPPVQFARVVPLLFNTFNGMASAPMDFTAVMNEMVDFPSTSCLTITIIDDSEVEPDESFTVAVTSSDPAVIPGDDVATVTISDVEAPIGTLSFEQSAYAVTETDSSQILEVCVIAQPPVTRNGITTVAFSFQFIGSAIEDEDFLQVLETITFNAGDSRMCINVTILGDDEEEETERFPIQIFSTEFGQSSTVVTINDDDGQDAPPVFGFENPELLVFDEDAGTVQVCVILESGTVSQTTVVTVTSDQLGGTATANEDYVSVFQALTFTPGASTTMCVNLVIINDEIGENDETLTCRLSTGRSAPVTIRDNDPVEFTFGQNAYTVNEGASLTVSVVANRLFENGPFQLTVRSQDGTATSVGAVPDFTAIDQDIVFSGPVMLTISTNSDSLNEGDEQFTLILTNTMNGVVRATATVTIANVPAVGASVGLELSAYTVSEEDEAVRVCVSLTQQVSSPVVVTVSTSDGTATAGSDYVALTVTLTFAEDDFRECVEIDLIDDSMREPFESFMVLLSDSTLPVFRSLSRVNILQDQDGQLIVTLQEPIMATDEGILRFPVCVDFVGSNLNRVIVVTLTTTETGAALENVDYITESMEITYFSPIEQVIICENITIIDDTLSEDIELFGVTLTSSDSAVSFIVTSGVIIIVDNDNPSLSAGFVQTDVRQPETDGLTGARLRAFVNGRITQPVALSVSVTGGTAIVNDDFTDSMAVLQFNTNSNNPRRVFYTINGDTMDEPDETIVFQLSGPSGVALVPDRTTAVVTIINDDMFPTEAGIIVLVDDTPEVRLEGGTGTVRIQFTLSPDITNALCTLRDVAPQQDCSSGTFVVTGLAPDRIPPVTLEIAARNQLGQQIAFISRTIRLGLNGDCSVNFLNGMEEALVFQGDVFIAFSIVGPATSTDCQLDGGTFTSCDGTVQYENLSLGEHRVKVRPNGSNCVRRIRRTVEFTVI